MFFLHDLDMSKEQCLPEVAEEDDFQLLSALGLSPVRAQQVMRQDRIWRGDEGIDEAAYPLGENLTWNELKVALSDMPWVILRQWSWPADLDSFCQPEQKSVEDVAANLFKVFTAQMWAALNASYKMADVSLRQAPESLKDALTCWSLDSLRARLKSYAVIPCNCPVRGKGPGPRAPSFAERASLYFVEAGQDLKKHWAPFARNPGYIAKYRMEKRNLEDDDKDRLDLALGKMLSYCQCLPNSKLDNAGTGCVWDVKQGNVILLSNPHYYKLRVVGLAGEKQRRARGPPAHATNWQLSMALLELEGYTAHVAKQTLRMEGVVKKTQSKNRRTGKAKNFRVPPKRGATRPLQENDDEASEEDEERPGNEQADDEDDEEDDGVEHEVEQEDDSDDEIELGDMHDGF